MSEILILTDEWDARLTQFKQNIEQVRPYSEKFINNVISEIGVMNSDFISSMQDTLANMTDTKAPELIKTLDTYLELLKATLNTVLETDKSLSEKY